MTELTQIEKTLKEQDALLERLTDGALTYGTVIDRDREAFVVATGSGAMRVQSVKGVKVGDVVSLTPETFQIVDVAERSTFGQIATLRRNVGPAVWEVERIGGGVMVAMISERVTTKLESGDVGVLDPSGLVVLAILPRQENPYHADFDRVVWGDIGGNETAKRELREALEIIQGGGKYHAAYKVAQPKGILFYGPPGCGKTMLGKAAATELAADGDGAFIYVKAPEILSKYVGDAEERVRALFATARDHHARSGQPAVIFIDEADAILQRRGSGVSSDTEKTIVPAFLTEMDGLSNSSAMVILATNRADTLDPAIIRDGRIDRRILIGRPEKAHGTEILEINLRKAPIAPGETVKSIAEAGADALYDRSKRVSEIISGALLAAAVDRAKRSAIRRDTKAKSVSGLCRNDMIEAVNELELEH